MFIPPHELDKILVKRIAALEGDTIEAKENTLYVNGEAINDSRYTQHVPNSLLYKRDFLPFSDPRYIPRSRAFANYNLLPRQFRMKFPKGHVFVMGDKWESWATSGMGIVIAVYGGLYQSMISKVKLS